MGYIQGRARNDRTMFPEALDDYVTPDNPVRVIDAFVDMQNLKSLGFERAEPAATGRPGYSPACLLKLYLYGYLNRIRGSRPMEREAGRNIEVLWLTGMLKPDFKTLADFRRDNGKGIQGACREFTLFCARQGLIKGELVAIDGSKFKAVNSAARNFSEAKLTAQIEALDARAKRYLEEMEQADAGDCGEPTGEEVRRALEVLRERRASAQGKLDQLAASGQTQVSLTDPEARAMKTGMHERVVGYNVQTAVDAEHKLIVAHEVTNRGNDRNELGDMATKTKDILKREALQVVADTGYSNADEVARCEAQGITVYLTPPSFPGNDQRGLYGKPRFAYDEHTDSYRCPAGQSLTYSSTSQHVGREVKLYRTSACTECSQRAQCTTAKDRGRVITRALNQSALDAAARRVRDNPQVMRERKCIVEHPFGTIKRAWGYGHFLMRGMAKVRTELSLTVLAYNMRRAINLLGTQTLVAALK
jgi:transposase